MKPAIVLLLLLPLWLPAQTRSSSGINLDSAPAIYTNDSLGARMSQAGSELTKFYKAYSVGTAITVTGGVMLAVGASVHHSSKSSDALVGAGAALGLAGVFVTIASHAHIKRAGLILQGNGIAIPIGRRRQ